MMTLSAAEAFSAYEAARGRLPNCVCGKPPARKIETLADIADMFDVFLLDAFGVLNIGESPIEGVPARVADLRAAGKRVLIVSNAASVPRDALVEKYARLGYDFAPEDIITSRSAAIAGLSHAPDLLWGVMGLPGETMQDFGPLRWRPLRDDPADYETAEGILMISSGDWTEARQDRLLQTLTHRPRPIFVANPDIVAPRDHGFSAEPGRFAHALADATGIDPVFFGKPFANVYDLAFARLGRVDRARVVMVGDSLHTDVLGAQAAGVASVLISGYGFFANEDAGHAISVSGITPDFIAGRP
ncbi:MAG: HAD-IIA family hydrolase [Pseudomonadota bacterium]